MTGDRCKLPFLNPNLLLCLSFLVCKMGWVMVPPSGGRDGKDRVLHTECSEQSTLSSSPSAKAANPSLSSENCDPNGSVSITS